MSKPHRADGQSADGQSADGQGATIRRVLVALLAATAAVAIISALEQPAAARPRRQAATLGTPLWSVRRVPQPTTDAVGMQHLQSALAARVGTFSGCFDVHDAIVTVASADPDALHTPASTLKLLTGTAAIAALGPDFHFTTTVVAPTPPKAGSVDHLTLVGGGDPLLATPERIALGDENPDTAGLVSTPLATLADRIIAAGVRAVPGGVVAVDERYDAARDVPVWSASERASIGPIGALTVNDGYTGANGSGAVATDPALNAATELTRLLAERNVAVGAPSRGRASTSATEIAAIDSAPLPAVLTEMLSASDNLTAEMLVRELGAQAGEGTTARGLKEARATLEKLGVPLTTATIVDGSGLSHSNAVTCTTLRDVLDLAGTAKFSPIRDGLAIAGERGTLARRLRDTPLAGNLRAKTGTLSGVTALAGFVGRDRPSTFALLVSGNFSESTAYAIREAMATEIAAFPTSTVGAGLVPEPFAPIPARACHDEEPAC